MASSIAFPSNICNSVIAVFHVNVRSVKMREKLSLHVVETLEDLWKMANSSAQGEEAANPSPKKDH